MAEASGNEAEKNVIGESMTRRDLARSAAALALTGVSLPTLAANESGRPAGLSMLQASDVRFDRHRLACYRGGEGPAVLLLHGNPGASETWRLQVAPLINAGFEVFAYDLLGTGRSSVSDTVADYAFKNELAGLGESLMRQGSIGCTL
jgi:pimeloyl-ACP methyl ester carboxylesterase